MKPLIIYHGGCPDGFGAAYAAWKKFGDEAIYHPGVYQEDPPNEAFEPRDVFLVDFSYKRPVIEKMLKFANRVVIIDHHKSAAEDLFSMHEREFPRLEQHFDLNHSGAVLSWLYFCPDMAVPELIHYIEDRDLWKFELPNSKEVNAALSSYPQDFEVWDKLMQTSIDLRSLMQEGGTLLRQFNKDLKDILAVATRRMVIGGVNVPCVNIPWVYGSEAGNILSKGEPFAAYYWDSEKYREFGLRSTSEGSEGDPMSVDVSVIAKKFGGGGHKHAAGFKVTRKQAEEFEI
jgi:oligoribonuclease NrnB/cAMP/cGMP phosphodiesterase (DHH superfamily)